MDGIRILVVEDSHDTAISFALLLKLWGYKPAVVYDGKRAIEVASTLCPDVIFLDIGLPVVSGYEVARELRRMPELAKTLLIAITGFGQERDIQRCKEAGIDLHFLKPVDAEDIRLVLISWEQMLKRIGSSMSVSDALRMDGGSMSPMWRRPKYHLED